MTQTMIDRRIGEIASLMLKGEINDKTISELRLLQLKRRNYLLNVDKFKIR